MSIPQEPAKSPFRFLLPVLLVLLLVGGGAFAVTRFLSNRGGGTDTPQAIEVTYWGLWEPNPVMEQIFTNFEQAHPGVDVKYEQQSHREYRERLQNALDRGAGPDIFRFHNTWTGMFSSYLEPVPDTVVKSDEYASLYYPVAAKWLKSGRDYVGIPLMFEGLSLYYNRTILEAAGKTPPTTWEELRRLAAELTVRDRNNQIQRAGVALGTTGNVDNWSDIVGLMMLQNGADPAKPNTKAGKGALTFYSLFTRGDQVWDSTMPPSTYAFATEKVVMMFGPSWRAFEIKDINPNLNFATAPVPQLPDGNISWGSFWAEGVSSKSSKTEQAMAWELLEYLNEKDTLRAFYAAASNQRLFGEPFARTDMAEQLATDPFVGSYVKQGPTAQSWYMAGRTWDNGPNDGIIKYYEDALNALNENKEVDKAMATLEQGVSQVMRQYNVR